MEPIIILMLLGSASAFNLRPTHGRRDALVCSFGLGLGFALSASTPCAAADANPNLNSLDPPRNLKGRTDAVTDGAPDLLPKSGLTCGELDSVGCKEAAGGNAYVEMLQARSAANRDRNNRAMYEQQARQLGYSEYFVAANKYFVMYRSTGKYGVLDPPEYEALKRSGKIDQGKVDVVLD